MANLSKSMQVLFIAAVALTEVVSVRVDDEQPQPMTAAVAPSAEEAIWAALAGREAATPDAVAETEQYLAINPQGVEPNGQYAAPPMGPSFRDSQTRYEGRYHGPPTMTRTTDAITNSLQAYHEANAARSSVSQSAAQQMYGAQIQAKIASDLAMYQARSQDQFVVTQATTQTAAQRSAMSVATAHAQEAASAHFRMVQSQEAEKIHAQEAKLAHADAINQKRAIEVHQVAEQKIKDIEASRALGLHNINTRADEEVASSHGGALSGIDGVTMKGKEEVIDVRALHPEANFGMPVNAEAQSHAAAAFDAQAHANVGAEAPANVGGFDSLHPDPRAAMYSSTGLGDAVQPMYPPMYPGSMHYGPDGPLHSGYAAAVPMDHVGYGPRYAAMAGPVDYSGAGMEGHVAAAAATAAADSAFYHGTGADIYR